MAGAHLPLILADRARAGVRYAMQDNIGQLTGDRPGSGQVRDLADVAWCALIERGTTITMPQIRNAAVRVGSLVVAPLAFVIAWFLLAPLLEVLGHALDSCAEVALDFLSLAIPVGSVANAVQAADQNSQSITEAALIVLLAAVAGWWGRRLGRKGGLHRPELVVPACLACGAVAVASIPDAGIVLGRVWSASITAIALWCAGLIGAGAVLRRLATYPRPIVTYAWALLGGYLALIVAFEGVMIVGLAAPRTDILLWYPLVDLSGAMSDRFGFFLLPTVLTFCTVLVITTVVTTVGPARARGPEARRKGSRAA